MYTSEGQVKTGNDELARLRGRHFRIIEMHEQGKDNRTIGELLGMTQSRISVILRSPNVQAEIVRRGELIKERSERDLTAKVLSAESILGMSENVAAYKLVELCRGGIKQETQLKAAESILDRSGHGKVTKQEIRAAHIVLDASAIDRLNSVTSLVFPDKPLDMTRDGAVA